MSGREGLFHVVICVKLSMQLQTTNNIGKSKMMFVSTLCKCISLNCIFLGFIVERLSALLKKLFETHVSGEGCFG